MVLKKLFLSIIILTIATFAFGQGAIVNYGNNPSAGKYYPIRGIKMYAEVYGKGKPLLIIHGNGGSINNFAKNIPFFAQRYQVIVADSRAHGHSTDARDSLSFEMMADDYAALLNAMHVHSAYVLGWSDGGINALVLAMRHPEKVIKLASTGANLWPDSTALISSYWKDEQKEYLAKKDMIFKTAKEKNDRKIFLLDWLEPNISLKDLKAIKCPSLIISGDRDLITLEHTVKLYQNITKSYLWILPNSGHGTLIEHTNEFNNKVDAFFSGSAF